MKKLLNARWFQQSWPFAVVALLFAVDKVSKYWAAIHFDHEPLRLNDFFGLVVYWNTGVSFSMLDSGLGPYWQYILAGFAFGVGAYLMWWQRKEPMLHRWGSVLIAGGAVGNAVDRLHWGAVCDFISLYYKDIYYFPTFNLADAFITVGVILFLYQSIFGKKSHAKK